MVKVNVQVDVIEFVFCFIIFFSESFLNSGVGPKLRVQVRGSLNLFAMYGGGVGEQNRQQMLGAS